MGLTLEGVTVTRDAFTLGPVSLSLDDEVLAVLGPSGSGKTTLLSVIAGVTTPDAGSVELGGRQLVGRPPEQRGVGMVFQEGALFPHMTARENVAYAARDAGRVGELASLLELEGTLDRKPAALSGGQRQRVALARTLAAEPDALLLDEPLSSLDAPIQARLRGEFHDLFASLDVPVLYVTHDQRTATALGDSVAIVRDGELEQVGPPAAVLTEPNSRFVARFTGTRNRFDGRVIDSDPDGVEVQIGSHTIRSTTDVAPGTGVAVCIHPSRVAVEPLAPRRQNDISNDPRTGPPADGDRRASDPHESASGERARDDAPVPPTADGEPLNAVTGTVTGWLNEGSEYRLDLTLDAEPLTLTVTVRPPTFDRLGIEDGSPIRLEIPPESVHLIPDDET